MAIEFYDVKLRKKVSVNNAYVAKVSFETKDGQTRYGLRGKTDDGRILTKFINKSDWESLNVTAKADYDPLLRRTRRRSMKRES
jgi:hypothetical protein